MSAVIISVLLLAVAVVTARQDVHKASTAIKDQDIANDQVTSILVQPGPNGPRHVVLSNDHQVIHSNDDDSVPFRSAKYHDVGLHHSAPSPLQHVTYGPARPVALRPQPLYHHGFAFGPKIPHLKDDRKKLSDAIYKYSTFVNHAKIADLNRDEQGYYSGENDGPDYSVTSQGRGSYRQNVQPEGLSAYRESYSPHHEDDEEKYKESIGDVYENDFEKKNDYSSEKRTKPLPYSKLFFKKQHAYVPVKLNNNKYYPLKSFDDEPYHDAPSGFDDQNGGKVTPTLARFYKQPLPVIQTRLPIDNVGGLYFQYFPIYRSEQEKQDFSSNFEHFPEERSSTGNLDSSESQWTPINAPADAVPAKSYDIPAPDLSRAGSSAAVVVGKKKTHSQHIQGNSEGVVSAVVRVKQ